MSHLPQFCENLSQEPPYIVQLIYGFAMRTSIFKLFRKKMQMQTAECGLYVYIMA
jgi:hypothetical protein